MCIRDRFSLALERTGHYQTDAFCEINPYCQALIREKNQSTPLFRDIRRLNDWLRKASILFAAVTLAKRTAVPQMNVAPPIRPSALNLDGKSYEPFAWYEPKSDSWKTWQARLTGDMELYSETWPP